MNCPFRVIYRNALTGKLATFSRHATWSEAAERCIEVMRLNQWCAWIACPEHNDDGTYRSVRS